MNILQIIEQPWPWYVAGPLVGLTVPALLILGNKSFGISSSLRHACAMCLPSNIPFFKYDWRKEVWNLFFVVGILIGGFLAMHFLIAAQPIAIDSRLKAELATYGITEIGGMVPSQLFSWQTIVTLRGFILMVVGGFLVGFGSRYAGGCTSGHSISGLSNLQLPSFIATCCFMAGGLIMANFILPHLLSL